MKALYAGSFDPFTIGHYEVLKQAEELFDEIDIVIAQHPQKDARFDLLERICSIESITKCKVSWSEKLVTDLLDYGKYDYLIRGLRNTSDYLYEEALFKQYQLLYPDVKVVYFRANSDVSSSFVYELSKRGKDISKYIPYDFKYLTKEFYMENGYK